MHLRYLAAAAAIALLSACAKHSEDVEPSEETLPQATLEMSQPLGGSFHHGDTVWFRGRALSTENIHGYDLAIRPSGDTTALFFQHVHDHNDTLNINSYWVNDRVAPQDLEASVVLYLDHDGHLLKKTIPFRVL